MSLIFQDFIFQTEKTGKIYLTHVLKRNPSKLITISRCCSNEFGETEFHLKKQEKCTLGDLLTYLILEEIRPNPSLTAAKTLFGHHHNSHANCSNHASGSYLKSNPLTWV